MYKRQLYYTLLKYADSKEALVVNGMRQVGKTTLLKQMYETIKSPYKLFLDLENVLNQKYFESVNYDSINTTLRDMARGGLEDKIFLFLDEIQHVKNLPSILKYLGDHFPYKFFLTGSVSFYLKNLFSESMAGRKFLFELTPLSFEEFLDLKKIRVKKPDLNWKIDLPFYELISPFYLEYITYGAFPSVATSLNVDEKINKLHDIFSSYFEKDVAGFSDFRKNKIIRDLMLLLLSRTGAKIELNKLSSELGINRVTLSEYLAYLESTYFIKLIKPYSRNIDTEIKKTAKVYVCDSGLANILGKTSFGQTLETAVFHQLYQKRNQDILQIGINYYQKKSGVEIDFILNKEYAFEVKENVHYPDENRLRKTAGELKLKKYYLLSYRYSTLKSNCFGFQL